MAVIRRKKSKEALLRRAHLGNIRNAEEILNLALQHGIKTAPLDIDALVNLMGISVVYDDLPKDTSGSLTKTADGWVCQVNKSHHPTRQRFTLAHELGHYILHRNKHTEFIDHSYYRQTEDSNTMEFEADSFAAHLLMPENDMRYYINNVSSEVANIAQHFNVSPSAVRIRAKQIGFKEVV